MNTGKTPGSNEFGVEDPADHTSLEVCSDDGFAEFSLDVGDWVLPRGEGHTPRQVASSSADRIETMSGETIRKSNLFPYALPLPGDGFTYCAREDADQWMAYHRDFPISKDWDLEWDRLLPGCTENDTYKHLYRRRLTMDEQA